jgi:hypothetical protein
MYIEINTDKNVNNLISIFENKDSIEIEFKIDSTNYGVGYQFLINEITCRVFDRREYFETEPLEIYNLIFEIDRKDKFSKEKQESVADRIINVLNESKIYFEIVVG